MSFLASALRTAYKLSGAKKSFSLPEDELLKVIEKQNRHRGVFTPKDKKACYEQITVKGFPCLIVRERPQPSRHAILYFFGGGMVIGPDKGDLPVMRKLVRETGCDVWFPFYPLCTVHCRILRRRAREPAYNMRPLLDREWYTATVCFLILKRQKRILI